MSAMKALYFKTKGNLWQISNFEIEVILMKKVLAINSGSSSFKYKLFTFPNEKVVASGMADRVGMANAVFKIKLNSILEPWMLI